MFNPFTNTQYNLQDLNNWSQDDITSNNMGTYTGNVASLNSSQLADLASMQVGGLTSTQLGQALAGMVDDAEARYNTRGPENTTVNNMNDQNVELTDSAKQQIDTLCKEHECYAVTLNVKGGGCAGFEYEWGIYETPD